MNDFLNEVWYSNTVRNYLVVLGVIVFVLVLKKIISRYLAGLLFQMLNRVWKNLDRESFKSLVAEPLGLFLVIFVSIVSLHKLNFPAEWNYEIYDFSLKTIVHCIATIILIVSFVRLLLRTIDFILIILER